MEEEEEMDKEKLIFFLSLGNYRYKYTLIYQFLFQH